MANVATEEACNAVHETIQILFCLCGVGMCTCKAITNKYIRQLLEIFFEARLSGAYSEDPNGEPQFYPLARMMIIQ